MHYQPLDSADEIDKNNWNSKFDELLYDNTVAKFPEFHEIRSQWKKKHPDPVILSTGEIIDKNRGKEFSRSISL